MLRILIAIIFILATSAIVLGVVMKLDQPTPPGFSELTSLQVDGNAEILYASADGQLLVHTNAKRKSIDIVDLSTPTAPATIASINMPGEPTSVGISPDGRWAMATVHVKAEKDEQRMTDPRLPGVLAVIDLRKPSEPILASIIGIGNHPDSIAVTTEGKRLVAVIAIENEQLWLKDGVTGYSEDAEVKADSVDISTGGVIQIVRVDPATPRNWSVNTIELSSDLLKNARMLAIDDPQPEFVALSPGRHMAAVSLQENNGIVLVDLAANDISGAFNLGSVKNRLADLIDDEQVSLTQNYPGDVETQSLAGIRFPDGIAFSPDGQYLLSADEGEMKLTGGRGFSIWSLAGEFVWDDGGEIERRAAELGLYPDHRSDKRGIEIEGITAARLGSRDFAFAVAERGSFMAIYDISNPHAPEFVQILPTGTGPEGIVAIPTRNLVVVAAEESGTLTVYHYEAGDNSATLLEKLQALF